MQNNPRLHPYNSKFLKINVHPGHSHTTQQEVELKQQITFQIGKIHNNDICLSLVLTC